MNLHTDIIYKWRFQLTGLQRFVPWCSSEFISSHVPAFSSSSSEEMTDFLSQYNFLISFPFVCLVLLRFIPSWRLKTSLSARFLPESEKAAGSSSLLQHLFDRLDTVLWYGTHGTFTLTLLTDSYLRPHWDLTIIFVVLLYTTNIIDYKNRLIYD